MVHAVQRANVFQRSQLAGTRGGDVDVTPVAGAAHDDLALQWGGWSRPGRMALWQVTCRREVGRAGGRAGQNTAGASAPSRQPLPYLHSAARHACLQLRHNCGSDVCLSGDAHAVGVFCAVVLPNRMAERGGGGGGGGEAQGTAGFGLRPPANPTRTREGAASPL